MLNIAIVGLGGMGAVHLENYRHIDGCRVVAGVDARDHAALARRFGIPIFNSVDELLHDMTPDLIDICTPTYLHYAHAHRALAAGVHTLVEKPLTLHKNDAAALYGTARQNGCQLYVGQVLRFTKPYRALQEAVAGGRLGAPVQAYFSRLSAVPAWSTGGWLLDGTKSGQLIYDLHIHDLDMIVGLFGKPASYQAIRSGGPAKGYAEHYCLHYAFSNLNVVAEAAWYDAPFPFAAGWRVYFEKGLLCFDGDRLIGYGSGEAPHVIDTAMDRAIGTGLNLPPTDMFLNELAHVVACAGQGRASDVVRQEDVLTVLEILEDIAFRA